MRIRQENLVGTEKLPDFSDSFFNREYKYRCRLLNTHLISTFIKTIHEHNLSIQIMQGSGEKRCLCLCNLLQITKAILRVIVFAPHSNPVTEEWTAPFPR